MASPPLVPGHQASRIASMFLSSHSKVSGLPFNRTKTIGLPNFFNSARNSFWIPGKSILVREAASPLMFSNSPITATITSAFLALLIAFWIMSLFASTISTPFAKLILLLSVMILFTPSSTLTANPFLSPEAAQEPMMLNSSLTKGPTKATFCSFFNGSTLLLFFSNTNDLLATSNAASRYSFL
ncbi:hypothetical protein D9M72_437300 [compost metagenome]